MKEWIHNRSIKFACRLLLCPLMLQHSAAWPPSSDSSVFLSNASQYRPRSLQDKTLDEEEEEEESSKKHDKTLKIQEWRLI